MAAREKPLRWHRYAEKYLKKTLKKAYQEGTLIQGATVNEEKQEVLRRLYKQKE